MTITLNGEKKNIPSCAEEITTHQYQRIVKEWDFKEPDIAKRDYFKLFCILTDTNFTKFHPSAHNEVTIWNAISWVVAQPFQFQSELPKALEIDGKIITIPQKIGALGIGQNIVLRQIIDQSEYIEENLSIATAVYLQPLIDNSKFDIDRAKELEKTIGQMPAYLIYPIGFFLLSRAAKDGLKHTSAWQRIQNNLKGILKRTFHRSRMSAGFMHSRTFH